MLRATRSSLVSHMKPSLSQANLQEEFQLAFCHATLLAEKCPALVSGYPILAHENPGKGEAGGHQFWANDGNLREKTRAASQWETTASVSYLKRPVIRKRNQPSAIGMTQHRGTEDGRLAAQVRSAHVRGTWRMDGANSSMLSRGATRNGGRLVAGGNKLLWQSQRSGRRLTRHRTHGLPQLPQVQLRARLQLRKRRVSCPAARSRVALPLSFSSDINRRVSIALLPAADAPQRPCATMDCIPLPIVCFQCGTDQNPCHCKVVGPTLGFATSVVMAVFCWPASILCGCCLTDAGKKMLAAPADTGGAVSNAIPI